MRHRRSPGTGLGFRVQGLGFRVQGLGLGSRVYVCVCVCMCVCVCARARVRACGRIYIYCHATWVASVSLPASTAIATASKAACFTSPLTTSPPPHPAAASPPPRSDNSPRSHLWGRWRSSASRHCRRPWIRPAPNLTPPVRPPRRGLYPERKTTKLRHLRTGSVVTCLPRLPPRGTPSRQAEGSVHGCP